MANRGRCSRSSSRWWACPPRPQWRSRFQAQRSLFASDPHRGPGRDRSLLECDRRERRRRERVRLAQGQMGLVLADHPARTDGSNDRSRSCGREARLRRDDDDEEDRHRCDRSGTTQRSPSYVAGERAVGLWAAGRASLQGDCGRPDPWRGSAAVLAGLSSCKPPPGQGSLNATSRICKTRPPGNTRTAAPRYSSRAAPRPNGPRSAPNAASRPPHTS